MLQRPSRQRCPSVHPRRGANLAESPTRHRCPAPRLVPLLEDATREDERELAGIPPYLIMRGQTTLIRMFGTEEISQLETVE